MRGWVLGLVVVVGAALAGARASAAPLNRADQRARAEARRLLAGARTPEHRALYRIVIPTTPSRLPPRYTIRHHANYIAWVPSSWVIDVERDERGARVERLDSEGFARGTVPADELDALVRLAFYLYQARTESLDDSRSMGSYSYASHMPQRQLDISGAGFALTTGYEQPLGDVVDGEALDRFAHTVLATRFEALVDAHVDPEEHLELDAAALVEAERRLRAIPRGATPMSQYDREDRDAVVARLLANVLVEARVEHAVPLLRRKGLDEPAYRLSLQTTALADLPRTLPGLLCSDEYEVHFSALQLVAEHREISRDALIYALGCRHSEDKVVGLLRELALAPPVEGASLRTLRPLLSDERSVAVRMSAARTLWQVDHDAEAERWLRNVALSGSTARGTIDDTQIDALMALRAGIDRSEPGHQRLAELALQMLRGVAMDVGGDRSNTGLVLSVAASYGDPSHAGPLVAWLDHPDALLLEDVIDALEQLDPKLACTEARARVSRYARGAPDYAHMVEPFMPLLVRHERELELDELRATEPMLRAEVPAAHDRRRLAHAALLAYFEAASPHRAEAALRVIASMPTLSRSTRDALVERHALDPQAVTRAEAAAEAMLPESE